MNTSLRIVPPIPTGYNLDDGPSRLSIIVPEATTNLLPNPSLELATTGWTGTAVTIARSLTRQYRGAYSLSCTRTAGADAYVSSATIAVTAGQPYTLSMYVYISQMRQQCAVLRLAWFSAGPTLISEVSSPVEYQEAGAWRRIVVSGYAPTGATLAAARVGMQGAETGAVMFVDALQLENKIYPTTYVDGDEAPLLTAQYPAPFGWNGAAHNSSSYRLATTRAGGRVVNLAELGLTVVATIGLGMPPVNAISDPLGLSDGSNYQRSIRAERPFTVAGQFSGLTNSALQRRRALLRGYVAHDRTGVDQPLVLRYERPGQGAAADIICSYTGGLEETADNRYAEDVSIGFTQWIPLVIHQGDTATQLDGSDTTTVTRILRQNVNGTFDTFTGGANGAVNAIIRGPDGNIYVAGAFTSIGGVAISGVAVYNPITGLFTALNAGATNNSIETLTFGPDGRLYAGGSFTTIGGTALNRIAVWNGATWSGLGAGGANSTVFTIAVDASNNVYAGGTFTSIGGVAINLAARWNGVTWAILGAGFTIAGVNAIYSIKIGPDSRIYIGGIFAIATADPGNYVVAWNGSTYDTLAGGANNSVTALAFGADGRLYVGGQFTTIGGISAARAAIYNGVAWTAMGSGLSGGAVPDVFQIVAAPDGTFWYAGSFTTAGGLALSDRVARWNGSAWVYPPVDLPGSPTVRAIFFPGDGSIWYGFNTTGSADLPGIATVTNTTDAPAYPTFIVNGPASSSAILYSLTNQTTGAALYFNVSVNAGEVVTLNLEPGNTSMISSTRGDLTTLILPGSSIGTWALIPGANQIVLFTGSTMGTSLLTWRPASLDVDDLIYR
jgi:hypothetical protein